MSTVKILLLLIPAGVDFKVKSLTVAGKRLKLSIWVRQYDNIHIKGQ